jgi:hypothetical protein
MVRQSIDGEHFLILIGYDSRHVFIQFLFPLFAHQACSAFNGKNNLNVNLRKRTCFNLLDYLAGYIICNERALD